MLPPLELVVGVGDGLKSGRVRVPDLVEDDTSLSGCRRKGRNEGEDVRFDEVAWWVGGCDAGERAMILSGGDGAQSRCVSQEYGDWKKSSET